MGRVPRAREIGLKMVQLIGALAVGRRDKPPLRRHGKPETSGGREPFGPARAGECLRVWASPGPVAEFPLDFPWQGNTTSRCLVE
jgi:hypothetical protein